LLQAIVPVELIVDQVNRNLWSKSFLRHENHASQLFSSIYMHRDIGTIINFFLQVFITHIITPITNKQHRLKVVANLNIMPIKIYQICYLLADDSYLSLRPYRIRRSTDAVSKTDTVRTQWLF